MKQTALKAIAVTLSGAFLALAQPESQSPQRRKQYRDIQEYTLYDSFTRETDAGRKLALLNAWKESYPDSDFKMERTQHFLTTYQQLGQPAKMIDTAKEILAIDPKDITALYWIAFLTPTLGNTSPDALDTAEKAANGLLVAEKPAAVKDEDWTKAKSQTDAVAYTILGWVAMQRKNNEVAEQNFKKSLTINPNAAQVSYWLGTVILAEKKPEKQSEALFDFTRAATYDGPGTLTPDGRQKIDAYLTKVYNTLHGDSSGLADVKALAKASAVPPPAFKIKTAAEIVAEKEEELKETNPELALWLNVKAELLSPDGQAYFDSSVKGGRVPKLKGWLVSAKPPVKSKELLVSMEGKDQPADVTLKLVGSDGTTTAPLTGKLETGVEIEFEGVGDSFTKDPTFMVTFDVENTRITVLAQQPQTRALPPAKKGVPTELSLRQFRQMFLNQRIVILKGSHVGFSYEDSLGGWQPMKQGPDGSFSSDSDKGAFIPYKYKHQTPKVIDIRENVVLEQAKERQTNALGETVTDKDIVNPSVRIIVQFDDGQLAEYSNIVSLIMDQHPVSPDHLDMEFMLASVRDVHAEILRQNLQSTIGQKVYAVHDSLLFAADITTEDLLDLGKRETKRLDDVKLLSPMTIVAANYNDRYDFVVWKLRLSDGRELISAARYQDDLSEAGNATSFLSRVTGTLLLKVPPNLTAQEISAIRNRRIFRGMSRQALLYSWGAASENDYGRGGKQLVYGNQFVYQFVYLDINGRVTDWQTVR
jgi:tetratricopeptide (TPR) repeat protein